MMMSTKRPASSNAKANTSAFPSFTRQACDRLFAAVLVHDDVHPDATLPAQIMLDYDQAQFAGAYGICRQLWRAGVDYSLFRALTDRIVRDGTLNAADMLAFKYMRAKYKHMHFACITLDVRHRYPRNFHWVTGIMGHVQDALRNNHPGGARRFALLLRLFLARPMLALVNAEVDDFQVTRPEEFRAHIRGQIAVIGEQLRVPTLTGSQFHEVRKVISRQVAFYDNMKILYPSSYHEMMSRYLSTINGLMGSMHDGLVQRQIAGTQDYRKDHFTMPAQIADRLSALVTLYPIPDAQ